MPSKEVVTFWLVMGAPMSLLLGSTAAADVLDEGRTSVKGVRSSSMDRRRDRSTTRPASVIRLTVQMHGGPKGGRGDGWNNAADRRTGAVGRRSPARPDIRLGGNAHGRDMDRSRGACVRGLPGL